MGEPSNTTKQPDTLDAVRTLLQAVQSPLTSWSELLDAAAGVLADLDPPLALVAFSPFAALRIPEADERPPASQPLAQQRVAPAAPTAGIGASTTKPVFALPTRKQEPTALAPTVVRNTASAAVALAQDHAGPQQTAPGDHGSAAAQALLSTMTQFATLTDTLLAGSPVTRAEQAITPDRHEATAPVLPMAQRRQAVQDDGLLTASADRVAPLWAAQPPGADKSPMATLLAAADGASWPAMTTPATVATADGALTETMTLLAGLTDALLTSPKVENVTHTAPPTPEKGALPSASTPSSSYTPEHATGFGGSSSLPTAAKAVHTQAPISSSTPTATSGVAAEAGRGMMPFPEGMGPSIMLMDALAASPALSAEALSPETLACGPLAPPDAWTLAQLINDVLAEEARRHGVDLS